LYQQKRMSAADAIRVVKNGDTIVVPTAVGEPPRIADCALRARRDFRDVRFRRFCRCVNTLFRSGNGRNVRHTAYFFSGASRPGGQEGWIDFIPGLFFRTAGADQSQPDSCRCRFSMASPMDEHGFFSLALAADYTMAAIAKAHAVVSKSTPMCLSPMVTATSTFRR
jgi:acyl-CoA hydrolase